MFDGNDRKVMENFRAGLRATAPRTRATASPVPDPEDLMRAACSAFTADQLDVYEFLERVDEIGLPRLVFVGGRLRRVKDVDVTDWS